MPLAALAASSDRVRLSEFRSRAAGLSFFPRTLADVFANDSSSSALRETFAKTVSSRLAWRLLIALVASTGRSRPNFEQEITNARE
jgi:hypothetical protein